VNQLSIVSCQFTILCGLCVSAVSFLSCSPRELPPRVAADGKIHLSYWESFNAEEKRVVDDLFAQFAEEYAAAHPDAPPVVIDAEGVPFDNMDQQLATAAQAGDTPDLVRIDYNKIISLAFGEVAVPLEGLTAFGELFPGETMDSLRSRFVGAAYDACVLWRLGERHLYALPEQVTCLALMWNRALFRQRRDAIAAAAGDSGLPLRYDQPPRTWKELAALGRALTWDDAGRRRFGFGMRGSLWFTLPYLHVHHVEVIHQDPESGRLSCTLASDEHAAMALARLRDFYQGGPEGKGFEGGAFTPSADQTDRGFENGSYAMVLEGSWNLRRWQDAGLDFGVALVPRLSSEEQEAFGVSDSENTTATNLGGAGIVIVRTARERGVANEALAFVAWWTSPRVQAEWGRALGQIPVNLEAQDLIRDEVDERTRTFLLQSRFARPGPRVPHYADLETHIFNPNLVSVFQGDLTPEVALRRIQRGIDAEILSLVNPD
jgi:ABC-type glycerol-3-phosphate transport system substrate-binding protein